MDFTDCCILCRALNKLDEEKLARLEGFYGLTPLDIAGLILARGIRSLEQDMELTDTYMEDEA